MRPLITQPALPGPTSATVITRGHDLRSRLQAALVRRFTIGRQLGGGAMSSVFMAREWGTGRAVAIKALADPDLEERARIRREAMVTARLHHPNVLPLLDAGESAGLAYLVTPYVAGGSLRDRLDRRAGPQPVGDVVRVLHALAGALAHAHAHGVIHGDVKPENVLLDGDRILLADFGAARLHPRPLYAGAGQGGLVHPAAATPTMGTPRYMPPEQALGDPRPDPRSDIYSLAAVGVELLTGQPPFTGPSTRAVLLAHLSEPVPSLTARPGVPIQLARLLERSLQKQPSDRPKSATEVAAALAMLLAPSPLVPFAPALSWGAPPPGTRRTGRAAAVAGALLMGTAAFAAAATLIVSAAMPPAAEVRVARGGITPPAAAAAAAPAPASCGSAAHTPSDGALRVIPARA